VHEPVFDNNLLVVVLELRARVRVSAKGFACLTFPGR